MNRTRAALVLSCASFALPMTAHAQRRRPREPAAATGQSALSPQAELHFRRAIQLATEHAELAALVEFRRAYELSRNSLVLFNIAAVEIELNRYHEGLATLEQYEREAPADVVRARRAQLDQMRERILSRSGVVRVPLEVAGLRVEFESVGRDLRIVREEREARAGARVPVGRYRVRVSAAGYRASESEFDVSSEQVVTLDRPLEATQTTVTIRSNVDDADVSVDGRRVGRTPLGPIPVSEGTHRIEVVRPGYSRFEITAMTQGTVSSVAANLLWLRGLTADEGARFAIDRDYSEIECALDGERVACDGTDVVPPGRHVLRVTGRDYETHESRVDLRTGRLERVDVRLVPRPAAQRESLDRQWAQRRSGLIFGGLGLGGAILSALWTLNTLDDFQQINALSSEVLRTVGGCSITMPMAATAAQLACARERLGAGFAYPLDTGPQLASAIAQIDGQRTGTVFLGGAGFALTVVGVGALVTGVVLFATAPGDRFATQPARRTLRTARAMRPTLNGFVLQF